MGKLKDNQGGASSSVKVVATGSGTFVEKAEPKRSRFFKPNKSVWHGKIVKHRVHSLPRFVNLTTSIDEVQTGTSEDVTQGAILLQVNYVGNRADAVTALKNMSVGMVDAKEKTGTKNKISFYEAFSGRRTAFSNGAIVSFGVGVAAASALPTMPVIAIGAAIVGGALGYGLTNEIPDE